VISLLKAYFQIDRRDDHRAMREKVAGKMASLDQKLEPARSAILSLLDVPAEDPAWQALDPSQRRQQTLDAVKRLLLRETRVQPVVVVFEDLHWIDTETQALLDSVVESLPTARLLLIVNYRPEYQHRWGSKTFYMQLRVDPLPPEGADELLRRLLGTDASLERLKPRLIQSTEGNPFFLEECVRTLVETDQLSGAPGAYRVRGDVPSIQVPASVQAILAARIDRLPAEDKRLLQSASVIGKDVAVWLLQAIANLTDDDLRLGLTRLQTAEFLYEARLFPDSEYTFKHALTHDVAYGSLLNERRRTLHARLVDVIERLSAERLAEHVGALAHHAFRGEAWDKAVEYCREAGTRAVTRSANREGAAFFEQALAAMARVPETTVTLGQAIDLRFDLRSALWPVSEPARILDLLRETQPLVECLGDARRLGRFNAVMSTSLWSVGRHDEAAAVGERALRIADDLGDLAHQVPARLRLSYVYYAQGDHHRAVELNCWVVAALPDELRYERFGSPGIQAVLARVWLGWSLAELGEFTEARARVDEAMAIAEAADQPYSLIRCVCRHGRSRSRPRRSRLRARRPRARGRGLPHLPRRHHGVLSAALVGARRHLRVVGAPLRCAAAR
jgi:predicted ATPase